MRTEIYYVSGTGNSLHVARELCHRLPEARLTPIVRMLHQDTIRASANTVGFVFPNFCLTIPIPLHDLLDGFVKSIIAQEAYVEPDPEASHELSFGIKMFDLLVPKSLNYRAHEYMYQRLVRFYSDSECTGCGICERVCLSERIELVDKKPVWKQDTRCYACFACINFCPQRAIQVESRFPIRSRTSENDRYHHPSVTYKDIAEQRQTQKRKHNVLSDTDRRTRQVFCVP